MGKIEEITLGCGEGKQSTVCKQKRCREYKQSIMERIIYTCCSKISLLNCKQKSLETIPMI